jgi:hypothetical protein
VSRRDDGGRRKTEEQGRQPEHQELSGGHADSHSHEAERPEKAFVLCENSFIGLVNIRKHA